MTPLSRKKAERRQTSLTKTVRMRHRHHRHRSLIGMTTDGYSFHHGHQIFDYSTPIMQHCDTSPAPSLRVTFLGTGTSVGVPSIGCGCKVCTSSDLHDKRLRSSILVESATTRLLIDCGPDFRQQILPLPFRPIHGVLLTHYHFDHVTGIDDLRPFCVFGTVDIYAEQTTIDNLRQTIPYCFGDNPYPGIPHLDFREATLHHPFTVGDIEIVPVRVMHGKMPIFGYRMGKLAYITDMKYMNDAELPYLDGITTLVVNALRFDNPHHSHQSVADAIAFAKKTTAQRVFFTHMSHQIGLHREVNRILPGNILLAFDGQVIDIG